MGDTIEVITYQNMHHGWMSARGDLKDGANIAEFERGYSQIAAFFSKHLS